MIVKKICITFSILWFSILNVSAQCEAWEDIGILDTWSWPSTLGADYTDITTDSNGLPYIVYHDDYQNNKASVKRYDGTKWEVIGNAGFSSSQADFTNIVLDNNNSPYVSYTDYANGKAVTVQKFDGNNWSVLGLAGFSAGEAYYNDMAFHPNGELYVAYMDASVGNKATVQKFNGVSWELVGNIGFSLDQVNDIKIEIDDNGTPDDESDDIVLAGLRPDSQRYFDHHHAANDTFEHVNKRELELGAATMTSLVFLIDKYGTQTITNKKEIKD